MTLQSVPAFSRNPRPRPWSAELPCEEDSLGMSSSFSRDSSGARGGLVTRRGSCRVLWRSEELAEKIPRSDLKSVCVFQCVCVCIECVSIGEGTMGPYGVYMRVC